MRRPGLLLVGILFSVFLNARSFAADIYSNPTEDDIPALIRSLADPNVQLGASRALASLQKSSVSLLENALRSESSELRIWAAYTLGQIGHDAAPAVAGLAATVAKATDSHERGVAARSLGQISTAGSADKSVAVQALVTGLSDSDAQVRIRSAVSLGQLGQDAQEATRQLVRLFGDEPVREAARVAVIRIGKAAIPELTTALGNNALRLDAAEALVRIDPKTARKAGVDRPSKKDLPALRLALLNKSRNEKSRIKAAKQLGNIGIDGAPILIAAFSIDSEQVARAAAAAFHQIGSPAVAVLTESLKSESAIVRARSADALGAIGADAKAAVPNLVTAMSDPDRTVQHRAVVALGAFGSSASEAVPGMIAVMQNPRVVEQTRQLSLKAFVKAASDDQRDLVIAALEKSTEDSNFGISSLASYTLKQLKADSGKKSP